MAYSSDGIRTLHPPKQAAAAADALAQQAFYDPLTGLTSPALCEDRLMHALAGDRGQYSGLAVLAIAPRNPLAQSHPGDLRVLSELAHRLRRHLRAGDTAAHFGDGLFIALVADIASVIDATRVAYRLLDVMQVDSAEAGQRTCIAVSAGVAFSRFCSGEATAERLLHEAQASLQQAWLGGSETVQITTLHVHEPDRSGA